MRSYLTATIALAATVGLLLATSEEPEVQAEPVQAACQCDPTLAKRVAELEAENEQQATEMAELRELVEATAKATVKDSLTVQPEPVVKQSLTTESHSPPHSQNWLLNGGSSREQLIAHLAGSNHGLSRSQLESKSLTELRAIHSSDHEGKLDRSRYGQTVTKAVRVYTAPSYSNCPGGRCPTYSYRGGLFRT